jgi:hypothetical protein
MPGAADRIRRFRLLHESGCFVISNPWGIGSNWSAQPADRRMLQSELDEA